MFYFYVLKSEKDNFIYYGYTNNLKRRLSEHNSGETRSTKGHHPLSLVYYEAYLSEEEAKHREYSIKQVVCPYPRSKADEVLGTQHHGCFFRIGMAHRPSKTHRVFSSSGQSPEVFKHRTLIKLNGRAKAQLMERIKKSVSPKP